MNKNIKDLKKQIKEHKATFAVYCVLRFFVMIAIVTNILSRNYESLFFCVLTLVLMLVPSFVEKKLRISLPTGLEITILLFIFSAEILGEMQNYYTRFPFWDTILHTVNGFLCAAIGFAMVDILNNDLKTKFKLSPFYLAVAAFCFSMTIGVIWEFFEFGCDVFLHTDMQKDQIVHHISSVMLNPDGMNKAVVIENITQTYVNGKSLPVNGYLDIGIYDTMKDLFVNFIGAVVFSVIGYFYVKSRGKNSFAKNFIPVPKKDGIENKEE
ncbi:MAG: hypothetical protein IJN39_02935 [Clostridia bacterium]|nr:hypothetical protein [Clostridia bacterium]